MYVRQKERVRLSSNLEKSCGTKSKGCALLPVSEKASDWLLLVPNYLVDPRKRRRRRVAPGAPTVPWPHTPSRAVRCQQTQLHSNTRTSCSSVLCRWSQSEVVCDGVCLLLLMVMEANCRVMEGRRRRPGAGKRLARLAHKLRHVVTKLAPEVGPLVREASGEAGRLVREAAYLLGCSGGNVEEEQEPEASKLTESGRCCCCWRSLS